MAIKTVQVIVNGQTHNLTYNSATQKYEATLTAPAGSSYPLDGGYYPVTLKAENTAGNNITIYSGDRTFGENLRLYVKERVKPIITITEPSSGAYVTENRPKIKFTVSDVSNGQESGYSGLDASNFEAKINGIPVSIESVKIEPQTDDRGIIKSAVCEITPDFDIPDGSCTITIDGADNDGNSADTATCTFTIDTLAPSLTVDSPQDFLETNRAVLTVSGTTDDATSKPVTVKIMFNGADQGNVTVDEGGHFSKDITLSQKDNTIIVTATDSAGKSTSVTRTVIYNTTAPVINSVVITPNPVDAGRTYTIAVEVE